MTRYSDECWYRDVCSDYSETCGASCIRLAEMSYLMEHSNIPVNKQTPVALTPPQIDYNVYVRLDTIRKSIVEFVENGQSLYITSGTTGNGKTSWAIKLMLRYFDSIWAGNGFRTRGLFVHVPTFLMKCKDFDNRDANFEELKALLPTVDLVIWDDIASTDISAYDYSNLLMFMDARDTNGKANIYTGNIVTREALETALGAKLASRVWTSGTEILEFRGGDRR